jgi:hypothetical protein
MARQRTRTQDCGTVQARQRLMQARGFLEVAELTADIEDPNLEYGGVAASVAILAGIAAADAACCQALERRSRSDDHRSAEALLAEVARGGKRAADRLRKLLALKDAAHYGFLSVTISQLKQALRQARQLVQFAEDVLQR